jgi:hypothetical protein
MTGEEQSVNTDPASIMNQIRRRLFEIAYWRKTEDRCGPSQARDTEIGTLIQNTLEGTGSS